ncbi:hypothetical protein ES332_D03G030800v1 [Gossypium tomentosum]|uniref:Uncharacterized protein n=1 Tax=Gossypium tomentosum TaxID=34277 RepID=A0A5D2LI30_GOSTO|nr:hypothetical protein ES332_D03G030800v1 [Gossypium tomentosum]
MESYEEKGEVEDEEQEEALSLCDLPVNLIEEKELKNEENGEPSQEEDFNFGSWPGHGGSFRSEPEMCVADEVFFKGQILPLRHSVSSDTGFRPHDSHNMSRSLSRSESMDHGSLSRFTSVSSSSTRSSSHYSTSSTNSKSGMKIRNNFNTHPSPKPQIRSTRTAVNSRIQRSSSMWDFFKIGLVRAPELGLQDLKMKPRNKNSVSRNSSCNSSNSSSSTKLVNHGSSTAEVSKNQQESNKGLLEKRLGLFSGCTCSVNAVETVPLNNNNNIKNSDKDKTTSHAAAAIEDKKKKKQALSRHRTFEWIKELSHATSYVDEA